MTMSSPPAHSQNPFVQQYQLCIPSLFAIASASSGVFATSPPGTPMPYWLQSDVYFLMSQVRLRTVFKRLAERYSCMLRFRRCCTELRIGASCSQRSAQCRRRCWELHTLTAALKAGPRLRYPSLNMLSGIEEGVCKCSTSWVSWEPGREHLRSQVQAADQSCSSGVGPPWQGFTCKASTCVVENIPSLSTTSPRCSSL